MAEHVASSIVGFVRAVVEADPFYLTPAASPYGFELSPQDTISGAYRLVPLSYRTVGAFDFSETRYDTFELTVARSHGGDMTAAMDGLVTLASSLVAAVAREGQVRDFDLLDEGRTYEVGRDPGQTYATARLVLPLSYAARL
jgi:hypothetical protein